MKNKILFLITVFCFSFNFAFCKTNLTNEFEIIKEQAASIKGVDKNLQEVKRSLTSMALRHLAASVEKRISAIEKKIIRFQGKIQELNDEEDSDYSTKYLKTYARKLESSEKSLFELKELLVNIEKLKSTI